MAIRAVLFDFDGTLVNSDEAVARSFQNAFSHFKLKAPDREAVFRHSGLPAVEWARALLRDQGVENPAMAEDVARHASDRYVNFFFPLLGKLDAGTEKALLALKKKHKLAIVTSNSRANLERALKLVKLPAVFDALVAVEDAEKSKPDAEPLLKAAEALGVEAGACAYVGDSELDAEAARNAGMRFILVSRERNQKMKGVERVANFAELSARLKSEKKREQGENRKPGEKRESREKNA